MKKMTSVLLTLVMVLALSGQAFATGAGTVLTLAATAETTSVSVEGTTDGVQAAVVVQVLSGETVLAMTSFVINDNAFSGTISNLSLTAGSTYTVRAANYDGGNWCSSSVTVPNPSPSRHHSSSGTKPVVAAPVDEIANAVANCKKDDACALKQFADLNAAEWYHDGIHACVANGLMNGVGDGQFGPAEKADRAMIITMIARLAGADDATGAEWYTNAVKWGVQNGITDGSEVLQKITREQIIVMLYRYSKLAGKDVSVGEDTNILSFDDAFEVSDWAMEAMQWAVGSGLIIGDGQLLRAGADATRAEIAAIFYRYQNGQNTTAEGFERG